MQTRKQKYEAGLASIHWADRREEILWRDAYTCTECGSREHLHVHHQYYEDGKEVWDYPDSCLITLCESCHFLLHKRNNLRKEIEKQRFQEGSTGKPILLAEVIANAIG